MSIVKKLLVGKVNKLNHHNFSPLKKNNSKY